MEAEELFNSIVFNKATFGTAVVSPTHGSALRGVMSELKAGGMGVIEIIALIPAIVDLIQEYGPKIAEIVAKVREMFKK